MKKLFFLFGWATALFAVDPSPRVILVVIDGVRHEESVDQSIMPGLQAMKKKGLSFEQFEISNSEGISLPAYADIFAGKRQKEITSNDLSPVELHSYSPTIFEEVTRQNKLKEEEVAIVPSWKKLCPLALSGNAEKSKMILDCSKAAPEKYEDSRADVETFASLKKILSEKTPKLVFAHFVDADEEAHAQSKKKKDKQDKGPYLDALKKSDEYVQSIEKLIDENPFYRNKTYLLVTTDHGRDTQWTDHGKCCLCENFKKSFLIIKGPGITAQNISTLRDHRDLAPTIAKIFGAKMHASQGKDLLTNPSRTQASLPPKH